MPLKILLIDQDADRAAALERTLCDAGFADVIRASDDRDFDGIVARHRPDLVIVDMALPDRDMLEAVRTLSGALPVVMFADSDDPGFAEAAIAAGVCSYNLSGVALHDVRPIMASAIALFRRYRRVEIELAEAREALDERRLIERAKAILMQGRKMTEPEAYRWLQKRAMDESRKIARVARDLVEAHEAGPDAPQAEGRRR